MQYELIKKTVTWFYKQTFQLHLCICIYICPILFRRIQSRQLKSVTKYLYENNYSQHYIGVIAKTCTPENGWYHIAFLSPKVTDHARAEYVARGHGPIIPPPFHSTRYHDISVSYNRNNACVCAAVWRVMFTSDAKEIYQNYGELYF